MSDNEINVSGNLTRDPELRFTQTGKPVCNAAIAVNNRTFRDGAWVDGDPCFFNLVVWAQLGENLAASCKKGDRIMVRGRLEQRNWETDDKQKRVSFEVIVEDVGPSFKWSTATVEKTNRASGYTNMSQPQHQYQPGPDEEPF